MRLNSKVTGGLAWAGLALVLAVPSADMLTKPSANSAMITSEMDAIQTASVAPAVKPVVPATRQAAETDVVDDYVSSGKKLPSYISDVPETAVQESATTKRLVVPTTTTTAVNPDGTFAGDYKANVASVAPKPYPASMRPKPTTASAAPPANDAAPLVIDEEELAQREAAIRPVEPFIPAESQQIVTEDELEEWDSGSLADYLERKGLIRESDQAAERLETQFDEDGFFLNDGPNNSKAKRRRVNDEVDFFLF
ncbi:MAG: hypothetical protein ACYC0C_15170 [Devosia sp.]